MSARQQSQLKSKWNAQNQESISKTTRLETISFHSSRQQSNIRLFQLDALSSH